MRLEKKQYDFENWLKIDWYYFLKEHNRIVKEKYRVDRIFKIKRFVVENVKCDEGDLVGHIELGSHETKSGNPHILEFIIEYKTVEH